MTRHPLGPATFLALVGYGLFVALMIFLWSMENQVTSAGMPYPEKSHAYAATVQDEEPEHREPPPPPPPPAPRSRAARSSPNLLACIAEGPYNAVSKSGKYRGKYQMDRDFWLTYGGDPAYAGTPDDRMTWRWEQASPEDQDRVALNGYAARGLDPWPPAQGKC